MMGAPELLRIKTNYWMNSLLEDWNRVVGNTTTVNTATSQSNYAADRIRTVSSGATVKHYSFVRSTSVPIATEAKFPFSHQFNCLTAIASPDPTDLVLPIRHHIEGIFYKDIHGSIVGFGFWVNLTAPAGVYPLTLPIAFKNHASNRSYVSTFQIAANSTWEHIFIPIQTDNGGVWLFDRNTGIAVTIGGMAGTNYLAPSLNQWVNGEYYSAAGVFNIMSNTGNVLRTTGYRAVKLGSLLDVVDETIHPRMGQNASHEEWLNGRYFQKSYRRDEPLATPGTDAGNTTRFSLPGSQAVRIPGVFVPRMRTGPLMQFFSAPSGAVNQVDINNVGQAVGASSPQETGFWTETTSVATGAITYGFQWSADADF